MGLPYGQLMETEKIMDGNLWYLFSVQMSLFQEFESMNEYAA